VYNISFGRESKLLLLFTLTALPSHFPQRPRPISARTSTLQHFPICDDMNDTADPIVPTTPQATHRRHYE